jgi:hypothetical protein
LQLNASGRLLFEGRSSGFYTSLGVSYRIDKHEDSYIEVDDNGQEILREKDYRGGFFKRLFTNLKKSDSRTKRKKTKRSRRKKNVRRNKKVKKETELEKLEREIKELEEELKKNEKNNNNN